MKGQLRISRVRRPRATLLAILTAWGRLLRARFVGPRPYCNEQQHQRHRLPSNRFEQKLVEQIEHRELIF